MNAIKQLRAARIKALQEGTPAPVAFFWDDPELTTVDSGSVFEIHFNDMIDDWFGISSAMVTEALLAADGRDVLVHVNSPGGMVFEGLSIYSQFKQYAGDVTMRVEGLAASAASFVICAGDKVLIEPGAMIMIHDAWDITIGDASEHRKAADVLDKVSNSIAAVYSEKAGSDTDTWRSAMVDESWYSGQEAVDAGLADEVVGAGAAAKAATRWTGVYARGARRPTAQTDWDGGKAPEQERAAPPAEPITAPEDPPVVEPDDEPPAPDTEPATTDLAQLLAGIDLSAALRNAIPQRGVPA